MRLAYNGEGYHGWQSQPNATSVQETIEIALATVLRTPVAITGAGRTDAGVSAATMYAHFDADIDPNDIPSLIRSLNRLVGRDIAIYDIVRVTDDAHARFDATSRTYKYFALRDKSPFFHRLAWQYPPDLDFDAMNEAAGILLSVSDFTSFAKLHSDTKTNICTVTHAEWTPVEGGPDGAMVFTITADRFLRNMVRAVVGTLVDVGRHKIDIDGFRRIIEQKNRCSAGTSMPPHALYLWDITYPTHIFTDNHES